MNIEQLEGYNKKDKTISVVDVCKKGLLIILPCFIIGIALYYIIYGWYDWSKQPWTDYFINAGIFIVGFVIHEGIHYLLNYIYSDKDKSSVVFGSDSNYLKTYCYTTKAITIKQYKLQLFLPLLITGIIPYLIGIIVGSFHMVIASSCLIGMCGVDVKLLLMFRKEKNDSYIVQEDKEDIYGGIVYSK